MLDDPKKETEVTETDEATTPSSTPDPPAAGKPAKKAKAAKQQKTDGKIYLLLNKATHEFEELTEDELIEEAGRISRDPKLQLIEGREIVPRISFVTPGA